MYVSTTNSLEGFGTLSKENVMKLGKVAVEALKTRGIDIQEKMAEMSGVSKEDLNINQGDLYTTAIASFIEKKLRPDLVAAGVIKSISVPNKGADSIKIPLRNELITAGDLPDSGQVTYATGSYTSTTISLRYSYAAQEVTHELLQMANYDLLAEELGEIGDAIARKVDSDIIASFQAATTTENGNLANLGSGTYVTYDDLVDAKASAKKNYAKPQVILFNASTEGRILKLGSFGFDTTAGIGALGRQGDNGNVYPVLQTIMGLKVVTSEQVDDKDIFLIDTDRTGYIARKNGVEVFDGRRSGYLSFEVIGAHAYGIGIIQPKSIYRIQQNND
jgi:HK97 family phage major capsid protein